MSLKYVLPIISPFSKYEAIETVAIKFGSVIFFRVQFKQVSRHGRLAILLTFF
jgi:hypothetical protein